MTLTDAYIRTRLIPYYHSANHIFIGYSGGIDSHVLLHLLTKIPALKSRITAVYVHHGLQACADDWEMHCRQITKALAVNFHVLRVNAQAAHGQSPEEAARNARYQAFKEILAAEDVLLFAQHRNDQLETVLLQLFRGAGLKGLSGMPATIEFAQGVLLRPLLDVSQDEIICYAKEHCLQWVEDPSNQELRFDRNYLRQKIVPLLEQRWQGISTSVSRVAEHCAEAQELLSARAKEKMQALYQADKQSLFVTGLLAHDETSQQWIIREWMDLLGARMPTQKVMAAILQDVLVAQQGSNPQVCHGEHTIRRYRDNLYLVPVRKQPDLGEIINWTDTNKPLFLADNGQLILQEAKQGITQQIWQQGIVQVKYRQGGEKVALAKRVGRHSLKKLYQEAGIAPWRRDAIPLVYINGELAAIADYWVSAGFYREGEACIELGWE